MRNDLTDITLIVDRSGSMATIQKEAEMGINAFIADQKKLEGEAVFTLMQFDTELDYVYQAVSMKGVNMYSLHPRGCTALLDAVGKVINDTGERLKNMSEDERPGLVVIAIVTDGEENSSHEFTKAKIKEMIEHQTNVYNWQFTYLGANQDAFAEAGSIGIAASATANYTGVASAAAYASLTSNVGRMRHAVYTHSPLSNTYTNDERTMMQKEDEGTN